MESNEVREMRADNINKILKAGNQIHEWQQIRRLRKLNTKATVEKSALTQSIPDYSPKAQEALGSSGSEDEGLK